MIRLGPPRCTAFDYDVATHLHGEPTTMSDDAMTIEAFQQHIRERYYATDSARGTPATFLWFIEEVGELATALHGDDEANKAEEFADVLAWLCTLANISGVDLTAAVRAKYLDRGGPAGHK